MKTFVTQGIMLTRTNFGEADRIITVLTPDQGKIRLIAKGVRRPKSKLAGGIELLSISDITCMPGKGDLGTLISARLKKNYSTIVKDINRTMAAYDFLKTMNKVTEDIAEAAYFDLLVDGLAGLDDPGISLEVIQLWFLMQLLQLTGQAPNLETDMAGNKLVADQAYVFSFDDMAFAPGPAGQASAPLIKVLRLSLKATTPQVLQKVQGAAALAAEALQLANTMSRLYLAI